MHIVKKTFKKRPYEVIAMSEIAFESAASILGGSIVNEETFIQSVGQELGPIYDFSEEIDSNTGKTFSHEWEVGEFGL